MFVFQNITHRSQRGTKLYSGITQENNTSLGIIMKNNSVYACRYNYILYCHFKLDVLHANMIWDIFPPPMKKNTQVMLHVLI